MDLKISKLEVPRVAAVHGGDEDGVASFLGQATVFVTTLLKMCGCDPANVDDEAYKQAVIITAEMQAEIMFNTVKAIQTQSGPELVRKLGEETDAEAN